MSLYFQSEKPTKENCTIQRWRNHAAEMRKILQGKAEECRDLRNEGRKLRYESQVSKTWDFYFNNVKLSDRIYEINVLVEYAETILPKLATEKKYVEEEKNLTETLLQKCDTWIEVCMECLNKLDAKLENELTRDDLGIEETKKEIKLLEEGKKALRADCLQAWEIAAKLEEIEAKIDLNLEFKKEVLKIEKRCQALNKMDTGVSYKVDPTGSPEKMLTIDEWSEVVYALVEEGQNQIIESTKLRERLLGTRGVVLNEYTIQFDKTDFELRKRLYEINREKNESQYQLMRVEELQEVTMAEVCRLEKFLDEVKNDLKCAETRCSDRYFRPFIEATSDPPFFGLNKEVISLRAKVEEVEDQIDKLRTFNNQIEEDGHKLGLEIEAKNKSLQIQSQALDIRIAGRYDPKKIYAYDPDILLSKMINQLPPLSLLYSDKF